MLAAAEPTGRAEQKILLIGNPVSPDLDFPSLPMFGLEMTRIESHFSSLEISALAGQQATPAAYFGRRTRTATLIFISSLTRSPAATSPLDSAIILSNPAGLRRFLQTLRPRDYPAPDRRRARHNLCVQWQRDPRATGEGLVGISRAFLRAGAQRVIGALWEVSDNSTLRLMDELTRALPPGIHPRLRCAMPSFPCCIPTQISGAVLLGGFPDLRPAISLDRSGNTTDGSDWIVESCVQRGYRRRDFRNVPPP